MILFYDLMPSSKVTSIGPSTQIILVYDKLKGPQKSDVLKRLLKVQHSV